MTIALRQRPLARVVQGIVQAGAGCWLDPSDMTTMYQDASGTTPVTAVEQPVGLILDKSQGLGPELVTNGDFSNGAAGWVLQSGWSVNSGQIVGTAVSINFSQALPIVGAVGDHYWVEFDVTITSGSIRAEIGVGFGATVTTSGHYKSLLKTTTTANTLYIYGPSAFTGTIDNVSVKKAYGYHATQSITASRPTLSARYNLLTKTEDFSDAAWGKSNCTVATNTTTDPFGCTNADTITGSSSASNAYIYQVVPAMISGATYTASRYVKAGSVTKCTLGIHQLADIYFDLNALTYNAIGTGFISASIVDVGNGWRKITGSWTWSGTIYHVYFALASTMSSQIGVPVGGYLYSFGHSLVLGPTSGPYQRVNTATDYDTDPRYFPKYLRFDGVDDYLNLPYMGLYAGGSASVVAAITVSPATWSTILAEGGGGGLYILARYTGTNKLGTFIRDDNVNELQTPITQGITTVFSVVDAGSAITHWVSSRLAGSSNYTRSGTLTNAVTLVGARPYLDTLNGNLYSLIITKSALTDAQRIKCERYAASKAGVIL